MANEQMTNEQMTNDGIRAVIFDHGGVLMRTADPVPRRELGRRFELEPDDVYAAVFESPLWNDSQLGRVSSAEFWADVGQLPAEEITLAEALKTKGYATGHFGKWHMGTLSTIGQDGNRGGARNQEHYSPTWDNGFDECFSAGLADRGRRQWPLMRRGHRGQ